MTPFDRDKYLREIKKEFSQNDAFFENFRKEFVSRLFKIILQYYPESLPTPRLYRDLRLYAEEIISTAEMAMFKDKTYVDFRLNEEVDILGRMLVGKPLPGNNSNFANVLHNEAKAMIVDYFPDIVELSGNGFRLLERYSKMYNAEFIVAFHSKQ